MMENINLIKKDEILNHIFNIFDDKSYLEINPDLQRALKENRIKSAKDHFKKHGYIEVLEGKRTLYKGIVRYNENRFINSHPEVNLLIKEGVVYSAFHYYLIVSSLRKNFRRMYGIYTYFVDNFIIDFDDLKKNVLARYIKLKLNSHTRIAFDNIKLFDFLNQNVLNNKKIIDSNCKYNKNKIDKDLISEHINSPYFVVDLEKNEFLKYLEISFKGVDFDLKSNINFYTSIDNKNWQIEYESSDYLTYKRAINEIVKIINILKSFEKLQVDSLITISIKLAELINNFNFISKKDKLIELKELMKKSIDNFNSVEQKQVNIDLKKGKKYYFCSYNDLFYFKDQFLFKKIKNIKLDIDLPIKYIWEISPKENISFIELNRHMMNKWLILNDKLKIMYAHGIEIELFRKLYFILTCFVKRDFEDILILIKSLLKEGKYKEVFNFMRNYDIDIEINDKNLIQLYNMVKNMSQRHIFTKPKIITRHGLQMPLYLKEPKKMVISMKRFQEIFKNNLQKDLIPFYGTLLGIIREKDFIAHDDDVDMIYIGNAKTFEDMLKERNEIINLLKTIPEIKILNVLNDGDYNFHVKVLDKVIDVFPTYIKDNKLHFFSASKIKEADINYVYPLKEINFYDEKILVPSVPEELLKIRYGESWHIPDPNYGFIRKVNDRFYLL